MVWTLVLILGGIVLCFISAALGGIEEPVGVFFTLLGAVLIVVGLLLLGLSFYQQWTAGEIVNRGEVLCLFGL